MNRNEGVLHTVGLPCAALVLAAVGLGRTGNSQENFEAPGPNIALGRTYTWNYEPDYHRWIGKPELKDPHDITHLTNGRYDPELSPLDAGVVAWGWRDGFKPLEITIDLARVEPIAGLSYRTYGGAGVAWPTGILVLVSDDGKVFHPAGELTGLSYRHTLPPVNGAHVYRTDALRTHGRYLRLVIVSAKHIFCDEIEVYRGDPGFLEIPRSQPVTDAAAFISAGATGRGIQLRMARDVALMRELIADSGMGRIGKGKLTRRLEGVADSAQKLEVNVGPGFRATLPLNPVHADIYALNSPILRSQGLEKLMVWHTSRWDPLLPVTSPSSGPVEKLPPLAMMRGEYHARTVNLTNPTDVADTVRISLTGLPGAPTPGWIEHHEILYTDSQDARILATALEPIEPTGGAYALEVPAGMTKQVWFRFHPDASTPPGDFDIRIELKGNDTSHSVTVDTHVSKLVFPDRVRCATTLWDYADGPRGDLARLGYENIGLAIQNMKDHFVNVVWAQLSAACIPWTADGQRTDPLAFNEQHQLVRPLDTAHFDKWVKLWGGKPRYYLVNLGFGPGKDWCEEFAGAAIGSSSFDARVGAWTAAWRRHVIGAGLQPDQVGILIQDEYSTDEHAKFILQWARPMKAGYPELQIFETVTQKQPHLSKIPELYDLIDIFCPALSYYDPDTAATKEFYADHVRKRGAKLWNYDNLPIPSADPYGQYRMLPWRSWARGMSGTGFWAYCDAGRGSWNRYAVDSAVHY